MKSTYNLVNKIGLEINSQESEDNIVLALVP